MPRIVRRTPCALRPRPYNLQLTCRVEGWLVGGLVGEWVSWCVGMLVRGWVGGLVRLFLWDGGYRWVCELVCLSYYYISIALPCL